MTGTKRQKMIVVMLLTAVLTAGSGCAGTRKDPETSKEAESDLRIYSVYEDDDLRKAVIAFQEAHPELTVSYEVGYTGDYGASLSDIQNNLATELAAGMGPDILLMDDLPYDSYVEKGILADLSGLREEMTAEAYFTGVVDGFASREGLFAVPMSFAVPVLGGDRALEEQIRDAKSLSDLAALVEEQRAQKPQVSVINFLAREDMLKHLSLASFGMWQNEDGSLNREAVAEFFTQAKRIYDAQMAGLPEALWETENDMYTEEDQNRLARTLGRGIYVPMLFKLQFSYLWELYYQEAPPELWGPYADGSAPDAKKWDPLYADYMPGNYADINGYLSCVDGTFFLMPGQQYGSCLPLGILAVNRASKHPEESRAFLEFCLSHQFQKDAGLFGFPVSRTAYYELQADTRNNPDAPIGSIRTGLGPDAYYTYYWPTEEEFNRLDELLSSVTGVSLCNSRIYELVIKKGAAVLSGETGVEEAVYEMEKELQIYLAE